MKKIFHYVRAIHPPIILVLTGILLSYLVFDMTQAPFRYIFGWPLVFLTIVAFFDGVNRLLEFRGVLRLVKPHITNESIERLLKRSKRTWCTREVAKAALKARLPKSRFSNYKNYYAKQGYHLLHIFPDGTFSKNSPWLTKEFYVKTFLGIFKNKRLKA